MKTREILETMRPKERFETIRRRQNDKINLRLRMTLIVCAELVVSLLISVGITALLRPYVDVNFKFLLPVVLIGTSLLLSASATTAISHIFLDPIKKLREAMGRIADGDFTVRLEEESFSKEIMEVYTGFNMMAHELGATEMLQSDFVSNVSHEF